MCNQGLFQILFGCDSPAFGCGSCALGCDSCVFFQKFSLLRLWFLLINLPSWSCNGMGNYCHVGPGLPNCNSDMLDILQELVCRAVPALAASLKTSFHCWSLVNVVWFCMYYCETYSDEPAKLLPLPFFLDRYNYYDPLNDFPFTSRRWYWYHSSAIRRYSKARKPNHRSWSYTKETSKNHLQQVIKEPTHILAGFSFIIEFIYPSHQDLAKESGV